MKLVIQLILFALAVFNIIAIAVALYKKKKDIALGLAFVEVILVALASM